MKELQNPIHGSPNSIKQAIASFVAYEFGELFLNYDNVSLEEAVQAVELPHQKLTAHNLAVRIVVVDSMRDSPFIRSIAWKNHRTCAREQFGLCIPGGKCSCLSVFQGSGSLCLSAHSKDLLSSEPSNCPGACLSVSASDFYLCSKWKCQ